MFGWEFPPSISGGLGTACEGLTGALAETGVNLTFVMPFGDLPENSENLKFIRIHEENESPFGPYPRLVCYAENLSPKEDSPLLPFPYPYPSGNVYSIRDIDAVANYAEECSKVIDVSSYDVIHCHDWLTVDAGIQAKKASGKPFVFHVHSLETDRSGDHPDPERMHLEQRGMTYADRIIAVSEYEKREMMDRYHVQENKIQVVYNGVNASEWTSEKAIVRSEFGPVITFIGRLARQKSPDLFIEAAAMLLQQKPETVFYIAGTGEMSDDLNRLATMLGVSDRIRFTGFLDRADIADLLAVTDVFVMPSKSEPFGIAALEAAAAGVPVVLSSKCGVGEVLTSAEIIESPNPASLTDAMLSLLDNPAHRSEMAECEQREAKTLSWENSAKRMLEVYRGVLKAQGEPS